MQTTITPRKAPHVMLGELDVIDPELSFYSKIPHLHENDEARKYVERLASQRAYVVSGFKNIELLPALDNRNVQYRRQYGSRITYHNYTNRELVFMDRTGIPVLVAPEIRKSGLDYPCVIIRKELHFENDVVATAAHEGIREMSPIHCPELKRVAPLLITERGLHTYGRKVALEYVVTEEEIDNDKQSVYHFKTDTLIYIKGLVDPPVHPHCAQYFAPISPQLPHYPKGERDTEVVMRYVSPDPNARPKYIRVANKTLAIHPELECPVKFIAVKSRDKKGNVEVPIEAAEYIEILYPTSADTGNPKSLGFRCTRVTVEEAKQYYGVFDTEAEAYQAGETYESRIRLAKERADLAELEHKRAVNELKTKILNLEAELAFKGRQLDQIKLDGGAYAEKVKERRETAAHKQRMNMEYFKFGATITTTLLGLVPLIMKIRAAT